MSAIQERAKELLSLKQFERLCYPELWRPLSMNQKRLDEIQVPSRRQYVLRMLIAAPFTGVQIPDKYNWTLPIVQTANTNQYQMGIRHPYTYLTIRHGVVNTEVDDEWHTDGFSQVYTHLPEQNYLWCNAYPTEWAAVKVGFPLDFDTMRHNVHLYLADKIEIIKPTIHTLLPKKVYCMDPYVIHRRPKEAFGKQRTLVRVSFTPMEICDKNNTRNPLIPRKYKRDGVKDFRDKLFRYPA